MAPARWRLAHQAFTEAIESGRCRGRAEVAAGEVGGDGGGCVGDDDEERRSWW